LHRMPGTSSLLFAKGERMNLLMLAGLVCLVVGLIKLAGWLGGGLILVILAVLVELS